MISDKRYCKFSLDKNGEDIHVSVCGLSPEGVADIVGTALNEQAAQVLKDKTHEERKENALNICRVFCDAVQIDTQDLNPWHPASEKPENSISIRDAPSFLVADTEGNAYVGMYDEERNQFAGKDGFVLTDAVWWKEIPNPPKEREGDNAYALRN